MGHTPGKLEFKKSADGTGDFGILASDATVGFVVIAETFADIRRASERAVDEAEANARRLVACWNLLTHFSTEKIEAGIDLVAEFDAIKAQRDELLHALEAFIAYDNYTVGDGIEMMALYDDAVTRARAAIAKAGAA